MKARNKANPIRLTERDIEILNFLWKWKLATQACLTKKFFENSNPLIAYKRLHELADDRLIERNSNRTGSLHYWTLTIKGFQTIKAMLLPLKEDCFNAIYPEHDHLVMSFHLGEWLKQFPPEVELFTEQEINSLDITNYPNWVPHVAHRPDGYSLVQIKGAPRAIAFEVELHQKASINYSSLARLYESEEKIFRVLWLVESANMADNILSKFHRAIGADATQIHNFVIKSDFTKQGWNALFYSGYEKGESIDYLLGNKEVKSRETIVPNFLLNGAKTLRNSALYAQSQETHFVNSIDFQSTNNPSQTRSL